MTASVTAGYQCTQPAPLIQASSLIILCCSPTDHTPLICHFFFGFLVKYYVCRLNFFFFLLTPFAALEIEMGKYYLLSNLLDSLVV